jgi:hypothetical protein
MFGVLMAVNIEIMIFGMLSFLRTRFREAGTRTGAVRKPVENARDIFFLSSFDKVHSFYIEPRFAFIGYVIEN